MAESGGREAGSHWELRGFIEKLDEWIDLESPSDDVRLIVGEWLLSRLDDPHSGMRREEDIDDLWFGPIPHSQHQGAVVVCSYFVRQRTRTVTCDRFATLALPI